MSNNATTTAGGDAHQNNQAPGNKRRRARKACVPCRQRKRKCDGSSPCEMCSTYGYTCQYDEDDSPLAPFVAQPAAKRARTQDGTGGDARSPGSGGNAASPNVDTPGTTGSARRRQRSPSCGYDGGMLDEQKTRYVGVSSAIAFPRVLGLELNSKNPPKLHSFGYNFGIRPEEQTDVFGTLTELISEEDLVIFSNVFFSVLGQIFDLLDQRTYTRRIRDYYRDPSQDVMFSSVAASVAAFGSFLSTNQGHPRELDIVQYAKRIIEDPTSLRKPSVDLIVAYGFRTVYLRATTRPNNSWIAGCTTMHLIEAMGMHEDDNIKRLAETPAMKGLGYDVERLRRIFWTSWSTNMITSHEYGRCSVRLPPVTVENIAPQIGSYAHLQVQLAQIIPSPNSPWTAPSEPRDQCESICQRIQALIEVPNGHPFIALTKADIIFCFYRRLRQLRLSVGNDVIDQIIAAGNEAVDAAVQFVKEGRPFWNILGSVFQFSCVLLAMDTPTSMANVGKAFRGLEAIVSAADTKLTREALTTARLLLKDTVNKKRQELSMLEELESYEDPEQNENSVPNVELPMDLTLNLDWDHFFDESYTNMMGNPEMMAPAAWINGIH